MYQGDNIASYRKSGSLEPKSSNPVLRLAITVTICIWDLQIEKVAKTEYIRSADISV